MSPGAGGSALSGCAEERSDEGSGCVAGSGLLSPPGLLLVGVDYLALDYIVGGG
jgi:hypothetical protein